MTEDCLIIGYDSSSDGTALTVAREENGKIKVLNTILCDDAFAIYQYLIGNKLLERKSEEQNCINDSIKYTAATLRKCDDGMFCPVCGSRVKL